MKLPLLPLLLLSALAALWAAGEPPAAGAVPETIEVRGVDCPLTTRSDGSQSVSLRATPRHTVMATRKADGSLETRCARSPEAFAEFLRKPAGDAPPPVER